MKLDVVKTVKTAGATIQKIGGRSLLKVRKISPELMLGCGIAIGVGCVVTACIATKKADAIVEETHEELDAIREEYSEEAGSKDEKKDSFKAYMNAGWKFVKLYSIPAALGGASIALILGSHGVLKKRYLGATAAYTALDEAFKDYRKRIAAIAGEESENRFFNGTEDGLELEVLDPETGEKKKVKGASKAAARKKCPYKFRDIRNVDNIVAKRGALFMIDLQKAVEEKGFTVAHVKTDSIKIPDATPEIIEFVMEFGQKYGYTFEHEATYEKMCLVNEAVYIAKYKGGKHDGEWTATGTQFQIPYVFKTLFSHEPIEFRDMCETKTVTSSLYLDMNETLPDVSNYEKELSKIENKDGIKFGAEARAEELHRLISEGHNYQFVGRAGSFCPMLPGAGGGLLMREKDGKFSSATGCKGYRWIEAEMVKTLGKQDQINRKYYAAMVDEAIATISEYGDFEAFAS